MDKFNGKYKITDCISVSGSTYAIGNNPNAPSPYAVWETNDTMTDFLFGHYFIDKNAAITDMIQRSTFRLTREDGIPLSVNFLTDYAREALETQLRKERANDTIKEVLEEILYDSKEYPTELTAEDLLQIPEFKMRVMEGYDNINHSEENYAIRQVICELLDENPRFLTPMPERISLDQMIRAAQEKKGTPPNRDLQHTPEK